MIALLNKNKEKAVWGYFQRVYSSKLNYPSQLFLKRQNLGMARRNMFSHWGYSLNILLVLYEGKKCNTFSEKWGSYTFICIILSVHINFNILTCSNPLLGNNLLWSQCCRKIFDFHLLHKPALYNIAISLEIVQGKHLSSVYSVS